MKLLFASLFVLLNYALVMAQQFSSMPGQEEAFNQKYKLTAAINEKTMTLKWSTDAPVIRAILSVYTKEQLAVRKGTDHLYPYTTPVNSYQFNLNAPAFKGFHAYWLKVYTKDSLWQEYYFQRRIAATPMVPKIDMDKLAGEGYTIIKTTINCTAGEQKVTGVLKGLEGVTDVKVDIQTGKLAILYSTDGTPYVQVLETINSYGFDADEQKTTKPGLNPCRLKKTTQ